MLLFSEWLAVCGERLRFIGFHFVSTYACLVAWVIWHHFGQGHVQIANISIGAFVGFSIGPNKTTFS
jgi:hypothetical protein